jgi:inner membrane protein
VSPLTHFVGSWLIAAATTDNARDRKLVTLAGVLPDVDGLGIFVDMARSAYSGQDTFYYYQNYHHYLTHGWPAAIAFTALLTCFARRHLRTAILCLLVFHLHLLCDLIGSRGPTPADIWPIYYGEPLFHRPVFLWHGQWSLDGWQNQILFAVLLLTELWLATRRGYSFVEIFNRKLDKIFVEVLQKWKRDLSGKKSGS